MNRNAFFAAMLSVCLVAACGPSRPVGGGASRTRGGAVTFKDDVAAFRPEPPAAPEAGQAARAEAPEPTQHVTQDMERLLAQIAQTNERIVTAQGYRVQVYSGNSREEANAIKQRIYNRYPGVNVYISYAQPSFRVKAGDYLQRLDAQKLYARLKNEFPVALIVEEQINIPKTTD
jgi:hypothetical protein